MAGSTAAETAFIASALEISAALTAEPRPKTAVVRRTVNRRFFNFYLTGEGGKPTLALAMQLSAVALRAGDSKKFDSKLARHRGAMSDCFWPPAVCHEWAGDEVV